MNLKPLDDRIVVRPKEAEEMTISGIVIPDTAKEKPQQGEVLAVGPGGLDKDGKRVPMGVAAGDRVLIPQVRTAATMKTKTTPSQTTLLWVCQCMSDG